MAMNDEELKMAKDIGNQMNGKIFCPAGCGTPDDRQELSTTGDYEDLLFCPHCEIEIQITVMDN